MVDFPPRPHRGYVASAHCCQCGVHAYPQRPRHRAVLYRHRRPSPRRRSHLHGVDDYRPGSPHLAAHPLPYRYLAASAGFCLAQRFRRSLGISSQYGRRHNLLPDCSGNAAIRRRKKYFVEPLSRSHIARHQLGQRHRRLWFAHRQPREPCRHLLHGRAYRTRVYVCAMDWPLRPDPFHHLPLQPVLSLASQNPGEKFSRHPGRIPENVRGAWAHAERRTHLLLAVCSRHPPGVRPSSLRRFLAGAETGVCFSHRRYADVHPPGRKGRSSPDMELRGKPRHVGHHDHGILRAGAGTHDHRNRRRQPHGRIFGGAPPHGRLRHHVPLLRFCLLHVRDVKQHGGRFHLHSDGYFPLRRPGAKPRPLYSWYGRRLLLCLRTAGHYPCYSRGFRARR